MQDTLRISRFGFVNAFLVPDEEGLTLIDTTLPGGGKKILRAAEQAGQPIRRILLTHAHGDHIGALDELHATLPDAEVIISTRDARLLTKDMSLDPGEPQTKLKGSYTGAKTSPTRTVEDGDRIGSLEVIASPGHTPGHVCFLDTRDRTLFAGDVYSSLGGVAVSARVNPRFPLIYMGTWDRATDVRSAERLRELEPSRLAPGHGRIVDSPLPAMDAALARVR